MLKLHTKRRDFSKNTGFSLLEMSVVLVILGFLMGGLLLSVSETRQSTNRSNTKNTLSEIREALYGFAQANGRLPCPATNASNGAESRNVSTGNCTRQFGFVPSNTLGLAGEINADGLLTDAWSSPYRYGVTASNGNAFTSSGGMSAISIPLLTPDLRICDGAACTRVIVDGLPAVILSLGADWATFNNADVDETENSGEATLGAYRLPGDKNFVQATYSEDHFDDQLSWLSANILYARMIAAGLLP